MPAPPSKRSQTSFKVLTLVQLAGVLALVPFVGPFIVLIWWAALMALTCGMWMAIVDPGDNPWHKASQEAKKIYWIGAILAGVGAFLFIGSLTVIIFEMASFWITVMLMHLWVFWGFDAWAGVGRFKKQQANERKLDQIMRPYVGKVPPTWVAQIADKGWKNYSRDKEGKLAWNTHAQTQPKSA